MSQGQTGMIYIALAVVFWGLWGFFGKIATRHHHPLALMMWVNLINVATVPLLLWILKSKGVALQHEARGLLVVGATAVVASLGGVMFYFALDKAPASVVVSLTAAYPALTVLLAVIFLGEKFTAMQGLGLLAILAGVMLVSGKG